jgi:hypothetical protein
MSPIGGPCRAARPPHGLRSCAACPPLALRVASTASRSSHRARCARFDHSATSPKLAQPSGTGLDEAAHYNEFEARQAPWPTRYRSRNSRMAR